MKKKGNFIFELTFLVMVLAILLTPNRSLAKAKSEPFVIGKIERLKSSVLKEERKIYIYSPFGYKRSKQKYPVLYLLDGESHFFHYSGLVHFFSRRNLGSPMIIVGIPNVDRGRDLSPVYVKELPNSGEADKFLDFIIDELIPFVEKNYRTQPYRILCGYSLGGLFSIYTLLTRPNMFNTFFAISPSLQLGNQFLLKKAENVLARQSHLKRFLYITVGNEPGYYPYIEEFKKILKAKAWKGLKWKYEWFEDEDHRSVPHLSFYKGLKTIFANWRLPMKVYKAGFSSVKKHYRKLSEEFGYQIHPPPDIINQLGYDLIETKIEKAIEIFTFCIELYPNFWFAYHNLGYCYHKKGKKELAIKNYKKSVKLNPHNTEAIKILKKLKKKK
jgi:predicted alpha/beta superfamily hydrolase